MALSPDEKIVSDVPLRVEPDRRWPNRHIASELHRLLKRINRTEEPDGRIPGPGSSYAKLMSEKFAIEKELGASLLWQELPHRSASRIIQTEHANLEDRDS